ncbi:hypothetical protein LMG19089_04623 [Ralstonia edaphis]|nr:hypothetical protein LMG19089_04623 [Ralstonia sp. LMG 6871]
MLFFSMLQYVWVAVRPLVGVPLLVGAAAAVRFLVMAARTMATSVCWKSSTACR